MAVVEEKDKRLQQHLLRAEKLHERGDLVNSLKELRQALGLARDQSERTEIQDSIREIREMLEYVSDMTEHDVSLSEFAVSFFKDNARRIYGVLIASTAVVLLAVSIGPLQQILSSPAPEPEPSVSVNNGEDKIVMGDNNVQDNPDYGAHSGNMSPVLKMEETDSRVTITLPDQFLAPYPEKYIMQATVLRNEADLKAGAVAQLKVNESVSVRGVSPDKKWAQVWNQENRSGWVPVLVLGDQRKLTAQEIDKAIFKQMGQKYWEIEVRGERPPYAYFLHVNAPDGKRAVQSLQDAYSAYAGRQLVSLANQQAQIKIKTFEVEPEPARFAMGDKEITLKLNLFSINEMNLRKQAGHKTLLIRRDLNSGRYILKMPLEGT
ncbi:hypothetical protein COW36_16970 [bacterium (Candidatus Blackallbacteria) CG17_big_fil_post_rev_8_21_14_2_50_48_46]|uniref:Uncharacterized protein n=1 Tax=bacterium (Candidatus Blackallbacteria) CG17_big_fil_post_rev_8_21_14_2_50_48_46 TaxID=2014261 RepID=A0A2M7G194_9BACT|nr:MAG: hypothetical protein COW64_09280 [bacterium (Candidatus Blackallbacteria) CG18_big_fil_WC_8_21_14_2_50_49_26]PIW15495.1 MAG: hypothetical protein COW36_16970 [bacterium (Candidatus Blackallbacteria) CG17_big_fil_post_rev_8_21_14_2_50_48_46]PIW48605.1 MAG: hypothetical protein COW20_08875 [bacterium (Candidatus Blackallbacteria) CG13_big_fil_rev_8_21_14_2_50_49_14]